MRKRPKWSDSGEPPSRSPSPASVEFCSDTAPGQGALQQPFSKGHWRLPSAEHTAKSESTGLFPQPGGSLPQPQGSLPQPQGIVPQPLLQRSCRTLSLPTSPFLKACTGSTLPHCQQLSSDPRQNQSQAPQCDDSSCHQTSELCDEERQQSFTSLLEQ